MSGHICWCGYRYRVRKFKPEKHRFQRSRSLTSIRDDARIWPLKTFEKYPFVENRELCLKTMNQRLEHKDLDATECEWAVDCVVDLIEQHDNLFREVLAWYLRGAKKRELSNKSVEFALFLWNARKLNSNWVSKHITPKLLSFGHEYSGINGLKFFLQELLNFYWRRGGGLRETTYRDDTWTCIERAVQIIAKNGDYEFLPDIEALIFFMEKNVIGPEERNVPRWIYGAKEMHIALLKAVRDLLKEKKMGDEFAKESKRIDCPYCLRYEGAGATEHHPFCPTVAEDPKQAIKDCQRGWRLYGKGIKRENLDPGNVANPHFMVGYNAAFLCGDDRKLFLDIKDLHLNEMEDRRK